MSSYIPTPPAPLPDFTSQNASTYKAAIDLAAARAAHVLWNTTPDVPWSWVLAPGWEAIDPALVLARSTAAWRTKYDRTIEQVAANALRPDYAGRPGYMIMPARTRLNLVSAAPTVAEGVSVTAQVYTMAFRGLGSVALSGAATATVVGTGKYEWVSYTFTATAGTLTLTPTGAVTDLQLMAGYAAVPPAQGEGSQVAVGADTLYALTSNIRGWNLDQGTLVVGGICPGSAGSSARGLFDLGNNTSGTSLGFFISSAGVCALKQTSGTSWISTGVTMAGLGLTAGKPFRVGFTWGGGNGQGAVGSASLVTSTSSLAFTWPTVSRLNLGCLYSSSYQLTTALTGAMYAPVTLSEAELMAACEV
jgi:hypothetical protein